MLSYKDGELPFHLSFNMANERKYERKVEFLKPLQKGHKCTICKLLLRAPLQTDCGHRFCLQCFYAYCGSGVCPEDNIVLTMGNAHPDRFCENEIKALEVFCQNKQHCSWTGTLASLEVGVSFLAKVNSRETPVKRRGSTGTNVHKYFF